MCMGHGQSQDRERRDGLSCQGRGAAASDEVTAIDETQKVQGGPASERGGPMEQKVLDHFSSL
jgi:hypothetical protein